jgi:hypothetical protein
MTNPVHSPEEVSPASSPQPPKRKTWTKPYFLAIGAMLLLIVIGLVAVSAFLRGANDPTTQQQPPAATSAVPTATAQAPAAQPTTPSEQARAFYAPGSPVAQYFASWTNDGGVSFMGHLSDSNDVLLAHWNDMYQWGCKNRQAWSQVLLGLVDVHNEMYTNWLTHGPDDPSQCAFPYEGGFGGSDAGTTPRQIALKTSMFPAGAPEVYTFVFAANPDNPSVGVWLMTDPASLPAGS